MTEAYMTDRIQHAIAADNMIRLFGMEVEEASETLSRVSAVVKEEFLQLHDLAHGAFMFALMDVAFALTVNAKVDAVAVQWSISQFRPAKLGEKVTAECRLLHGGRRLMVVELLTRGPEGRVLAKGQATAIPVGEAAPVHKPC
ncbi:MAG: hotdog fold thioesterase [Actinomycetia bacterium]|nr:hotdog fold thioesterase [Actinomycetes bacterium]